MNYITYWENKYLIISFNHDNRNIIYNETQLDNLLFDTLCIFIESNSKEMLNSAAFYYVISVLRKDNKQIYGIYTPINHFSEKIWEMLNSKDIETFKMGLNLLL